MKNITSRDSIAAIMRALLKNSPALILVFATILLSGFLPFFGHNIPKEIKKIAIIDVVFDLRVPQVISGDGSGNKNYIFDARENGPDINKLIGKEEKTFLDKTTFQIIEAFVSHSAVELVRPETLAKNKYYQSMLSQDLVAHEYLVPGYKKVLPDWKFYDGLDMTLSKEKAKEIVAALNVDAIVIIKHRFERVHYPAIIFIRDKDRTLMTLATLLLIYNKNGDRVITYADYSLSEEGEHDKNPSPRVLMAGVSAKRYPGAIRSTIKRIKDRITHN